MYEIKDVEYSWNEMSYNKYPCLTQHKRLSVEYIMSKINFEINKDEDNEDEFVWGGW